jgi:hypothetical protein
MQEGPTAERLRKTEGDFVLVGRSRSSRRLTMYDDTLGRAWMRHRVSALEYTALQRYAHHWARGGLLGPLQSADLDRVYASNPDGMSGLAKTAAQLDHRNKFHYARSRSASGPRWWPIAPPCTICRSWRLARCWASAARRGAGLPPTRYSPTPATGCRRCGRRSTGRLTEGRFGTRFRYGRAHAPIGPTESSIPAPLDAKRPPLMPGAFSVSGMRYDRLKKEAFMYAAYQDRRKSR